MNMVQHTEFNAHRATPQLRCGSTTIYRMLPKRLAATAAGAEVFDIQRNADFFALLVIVGAQNQGCEHRQGQHQQNCHHKNGSFQHVSERCRDTKPILQV